MRKGSGRYAGRQNLFSGRLLAANDDPWLKKPMADFFNILLLYDFSR
jgi:hypothetical protein